MFLSTHLCQVLQPWRWYGSRFSGPVCLNRPYVVGSLLCQIGSASSLACLVYRSRSGQRSVELPMKENVSGYLRNPCSLSRERDTAFAAKLLTLPTGFFSAEKSEEWMARSPLWPDDVIASETASRHQPMNWRDSIWVQDSVTRRRSRSGQRSVSFPTQRTRVTQVTRDVLCCEMKWINLTIAILDFGVRLYGGSELSKHLSKCLLRMQKTPKKSVSVRRTKISEAVCNRDWHNVRSYLFFYVRTFWTQCAMNLRSYLLLLCEILWAKSSHSKRDCACTRETSAQSSLDTCLWTSIFGSSTSSL